ncbi:phosphoribosyltransferase-like protein [Pseudomonas aeruginosa]|uniref:phosphoribosyltransferase-like protein n=1 Tax=Pseudomonas aeruginosa TaxID=287 RepID=UPI000B2B65EB|nr:hypothetical protein [Pseudomonas aeruginosa]
MNTKEFSVLFSLSQAQEWLEDKELELKNLIFKECNSNEERELICSLIERFTYLSMKNYCDAVDKLIDNVISIDGLEDSNTTFAAMSADSGADSSQYIIYDLKLILERKKWRKHKLKSRYTSAYDEFKKDSSYKNIVLIDEFVGSGQTVLGRIKTIKQQFGKANDGNYNLFVRTVASTKSGAETIRNAGIDFESIITLERGISDHYDSNSSEEKIGIMIQLEDILSKEYEGKEMPSLGYGKAESLYCRERGNTPNNVFPIFWWPFLAAGGERDVILHRAMGDA